MFHFFAILGMATGYYSGVNMQVNFISNNAYIQDNYFYFDAELWYIEPSATTARYVINLGEISTQIPTSSTRQNPYAVIATITFNTLSILNDELDTYMEYSFSININYSVLYYVGAELFFDTTASYTGTITDIFGDRRVIDRDATNRTFKFTFLDQEQIHSHGYSEGFENGYSSGYDTAILENELNNGVWGLLKSCFDAVNSVLNVEILPSIKLWYILGIPVVFGIIAFFLNLWR